MILRTQGDYQVFWSKEHNREYYFHPATGTTVWSLPQQAAPPPPQATTTVNATAVVATTPATSATTTTPATTGNAHARKPSDAELAKLFEELGRDGQNWAKLEQKEFAMLIETKKSRFLSEQKSLEDVIAASNLKMTTTPKKDKNYNVIIQSAKAAKEGAIEAISNSRINRKEEELLLQKVIKYREEERRIAPRNPIVTPTPTPVTTTTATNNTATLTATPSGPSTPGSTPKSTPHHSPSNSIDKGMLGVTATTNSRMSVGSAAALANPEMLKFLQDRGGAGLLSSLSSTVPNSAPQMTRMSSPSISAPPSTTPVSYAPVHHTPQAPPGALRVQGDYHVYYSQEHKREYYFHLPTQQTVWSLPASAPVSTPPKQQPQGGGLSHSTSFTRSSPSLSPSPSLPLSSSTPSFAQSFPPAQTHSPSSHTASSFPAAASASTASEGTPRCDRAGCAKWAYKDGLCKMHAENLNVELPRTESGPSSTTPSPTPSPNGGGGSLADQILAAKAAQAAKAAAKQEASAGANGEERAARSPSPAPSSGGGGGSLADQILAAKAAQAAKAAAKQQDSTLLSAGSNNENGRNRSSSGSNANNNNNSGGGSFSDQILAARAAQQAKAAAKLEAADKGGTTTNSSNENSSSSASTSNDDSNKGSSGGTNALASVAASIAAAKKKREEKEAAEKIERERIQAEKETALKAERERKAAIAKIAEEKKQAEKLANEKIEAERKAAIAAQKLLEEQKAAQKAEKQAKKEQEKKLAEERAAQEKERMIKEATERLMAEKAKQLLAEQDEAADNEVMAKLTTDVQKVLGLDFVEKLHALKRATGSAEDVARLVRVMLQRSTPYRPGDKPSFWTAPVEKNAGGFTPVVSSRANGGFTKAEAKPAATTTATTTVPPTTKVAPPPPQKRISTINTPLLPLSPATSNSNITPPSESPSKPAADKIVPKGNCIDPNCDCVDFQPDAFRKEKCRNCFHNHSPAVMKAKQEQEEAAELKRKQEADNINKEEEEAKKKTLEEEEEKKKKLEEEEKKKKKIEEEEEEAKKLEEVKKIEEAKRIEAENKLAEAKKKEEEETKQKEEEEIKKKKAEELKKIEEAEEERKKIEDVDKEANKKLTEEKEVKINEEENMKTPKEDGGVDIQNDKLQPSSEEPRKSLSESAANASTENDQKTPIADANPITTTSERRRSAPPPPPPQPIPTTDNTPEPVATSDTTTDAATTTDTTATPTTPTTPTNSTSSTAEAADDSSASLIITLLPTSEVGSSEGLPNTADAAAATTESENGLSEAEKSIEEQMRALDERLRLFEEQSKALELAQAALDTSIPTNDGANAGRRLSTDVGDSANRRLSTDATTTTRRSSAVDVADTATTSTSTSPTSHDVIATSVGRLSSSNILPSDVFGARRSSVSADGTIGSPTVENSDNGPGSRRPSAGNGEPDSVRRASTDASVVSTPLSAAPTAIEGVSEQGTSTEISSNSPTEAGDSVSAASSESLEKADENDELLSAPSTPLAHARKKSTSSRRATATIKRSFSSNSIIVEAHAVEGYGDEPARVSYLGTSEANDTPQDRAKTMGGVSMVSGGMMAEMLRKKKVQEPNGDSSGFEFPENKASSSLSIESVAPVRKSSVGLPMVGGNAMMEEMKRKREEAGQRPRALSAQPARIPAQPAPPSTNFLEDMKRKKEAKAATAAVEKS